MVFGTPSSSANQTSFNDTLGTSWPIVAFAILVLFLGVYHPVQLTNLLNEAVTYLEITKPI
jgi:F0F1-type ATP synthase membrane subunit b/b'